MADHLAGCCRPVIGGRPASGGDGGGCTLGLEEYVTEQDDTVFATSSNVWVPTGHQLVTPALPAGSYFIGVAYWGGADAYWDSDWRVRLDSVSDVWPTIHRESMDSDDEIKPYFRTREITLTAGVHTFHTEARVQAPSNGSTTRQVYFELWRTPPSSAGQCITPCQCENQNLVNQWVVTGRMLAGRTFATGVLEAGVYRVALSFPYSNGGGSSVDYNMDQDAAGNLFPTSARERRQRFQWQARYMVREVILAAGPHTFDLVLNSSSSTTITIGQTTWTLHRVDGS